MKRYICFVSFLLLTGLAPDLNAQYGFNVIRTFGETGHEVVFASFSPDGTYIVTAGTDSSLIIWNAERQTIYWTLSGLDGKQNAALFSADNKYLYSGGVDKKVSVWDLSVRPPKMAKTYEGFPGPVKSIDLSPDGRYLAAGSTGGSVRVWDIRNSSLVYDLRVKNKTKDINSVAFGSGGKILAAGGADGIMTVWNTDNGIMTGSQPGQKGIHHITVSPDGKLLASCGYENDIILWQLPGFSNKVILKGHKDWVQTIDFSPDSKSLVSGGRDEYIILWDVTSGKILHKSEKQPDVVMFLDFNPSQPDFISSLYKSETIEKWTVAGLDEAQWKKPAAITTAEKITENIPVNQQKAAEQPAVNAAEAGSMIEIFSPVAVQGRVTNDKNSITIVGRVSDPQGINTLLINRNPVKPSAGGVFQYDLPLSKGENLVSLIAISNKGIMNEKKLVIDCIAENAAVAGESLPEIARGKFFALLIGINEYQYDEINDLDNPVRDAQSLYDVLISKYSFEKENIIFLKNPTYAEMFSTLDKLGSKLTSTDNLLIFYAGHGYWDDKAKVGYWLPSDASRGSKVNWFSNSQLRDLLGGIQTRHTLLIADACFSGAIFKSRAAFTETPQGIQKLYEIPSRKAMTSGIFSQEVPDESMFIKYLVKKLDENKEQFLTSESLFSNLKPAVMSNSANIPQYGVIQNVGDEGGGDFIFVHK